MKLALQTADRAIPELARYQRQVVIAAVVGIVTSGIGLWLSPAQFFRSYLVAYMFVLGITLGCLALGMVHQLSGGTWGVVIRRPMEAASRTLPVLTLLFLPIALGMGHLYIWTNPEEVARDASLQWKRPYLNTPFFLIRAVVYFGAWNAVAYFLNRWSIEQDERGDPRTARRMQVLSAGGLLAYGLTISFAAFDWVMSLEPHWFSTIFGVLVMGGQALSGLTFSIVVLTWLSRRPPLKDVVLPEHLHDLGNLLLAFVMLWAYFSFSQYLIIWSGDLPEETDWYMRRTETTWSVLALILVMFHFMVPFLLLLSRLIKRNRNTLVSVAAALLALRLADLFWLTAPSFYAEGITVHLLDLVLPVTMCSIWFASFIWQLRARTLLPLHDPQTDETIGALEKNQAHQP